MIFKRSLSVIVVATLLLTFISTAIATPAQGKSSRVAVITDLKGSATIKNAGSSREYDAYIDMGLSQGDYITTDANSSVKVTIKDHQDEFTIGANTVISITTLTDKGKGKKSKVNVLAGSVWSNVKKLSGGDDYEVETPTAVMAVRGTKVLTSVNSETGETYVAVAAGTVSAETSTDNTDKNTETHNVLIAASQQLSLDSRTEVNDLENKVAIIDPEKLINGTSAEIIQAIVKDKKSIDEENAEFIATQKAKIAKGEKTDISRGDANSSLTTNDLAALDKVSKNLDNLIGNVVNKAIESNKVDKDVINKIIEDVNKSITDPNLKLDLTKVIPLDKTAGVDEKLQKAKDEELKKLEDAKKIAAAEQKAADDAKALKLAEALKKLETEKTRIAVEKEVLGLNKPTPTPNPTASPIPATIKPPSIPTPTPERVATPTFNVPAGSYSGPQNVVISSTVGAAVYYTIDNSVPTSASNYYTGAITVSSTQTITAIAVKAGMTNSAIASALYTIAPYFSTPTFTADDTGGFTLDLGINNLSLLNQIAGVEVHIVSDSGTWLQAKGDSLSDFFGQGSEIRFNNPPNIYNEIIYAAVLPISILYPISGNQKLVSLPLNLYSGDATKNNITIHVKVVRNDGTIIIETLTSPLQITVPINSAPINLAP